MNAKYYEVPVSDEIQKVTKEVFESRYSNKDGMFFITIHENNSVKLEKFLVDLKVQEKTIYNCLHPRNMSIVLPTDKEIYFEYAVCVYDKEGLAHEHYVSFLCLENLVISMNASPLMNDERADDIAQHLKRMNSSIPALLSALLARETLLVSRSALSLRTGLYALDHRMDKDPDSVELKEIHDYKQTLRTYDAISNAQMACLGMIKGLDKELLSLIDYPMYMQLATTSSTNTSYILLRLEKTITDLIQHYDANAQDKMNHRLGVLTILSAIFMPITFMAGIFGMNFDNMPGLHFTWSYPIALTSMELISFGLYFYFKKNGWLE